MSSAYPKSLLCFLPTLFVPFNVFFLTSCSSPLVCPFRFPPILSSIPWRFPSPLFFPYLLRVCLLLVRPALPLAVSMFSLLSPNFPITVSLLLKFYPLPRSRPPPPLVLSRFLSGSTPFDALLLVPALGPGPPCSALPALAPPFLASPPGLFFRAVPLLRVSLLFLFLPPVLLILDRALLGLFFSPRPLPA